MALEVGEGGLEKLRRAGLALEVEEDRLAEPFLDRSVPQIEATATHALGSTGAGQTVVVLDTGVDAGHPALVGQVHSGACFSSGATFTQGDCPGGGTRAVGPQAGVPCTYASHCLHGTAVAGVVAGDHEDFPGVAPGAQVFPIQIFSAFSGSACGASGGTCARSWTSDQVAALEFVYDVLRFVYPIAAVNLSLGSGGWRSPESCDLANQAIGAAIDDLRAVGIPTVVAAGNGGQADAIGSPACVSGAVSVGAVDDYDVAAAISNRSRYLTFWAPGVRIRAPLAGTQDFRNVTGTSYAAPHVSGALALLRQLMPQVPLPNLLWLLRLTGETVFDTEAVTTRIRVRRAVAATLGPCANLIDDDGDGLVDYPDDPGCRDPFHPVEDPPCDDRIDNDGDGRVDSHGLDRNGNGVLNRQPDPECLGRAWHIAEDQADPACGLGFEVAPVLVGIAALRRRSRQRA